MPVVRITTTGNNISDGFEARFTDFLATLLPHKSKSHIFVMVNQNSKVYNCALSQDCKGDLLMLEIQSMDAFTPDTVGSQRKSLVEFLHSETKIAEDRILVVLTDVPPNFAGIGR